MSIASVFLYGVLSVSILFDVPKLNMPETLVTFDMLKLETSRVLSAVQPENM